jgi:predicted sulfurtransferase
MIPVIMGAIGTISESLRQYLNDIPGKHELKELQKKKIAVFCTAHVMRKLVE